MAKWRKAAGSGNNQRLDSRTLRMSGDDRMKNENGLVFLSTKKHRVWQVGSFWGAKFAARAG